jgi:telomerase reverse transcriptase
LERLGAAPQATGLLPDSTLRPSINQNLQGSHAILRYGSESDSSSIGSGIFSVSDIYPKLRKFRDRLRTSPKGSKLRVCHQPCFWVSALRSPPLYFVKTDVKACFDTIPPDKVLSLVRRLVKADNYVILKYSKHMFSSSRIVQRFEKVAVEDGQ